MKSSIALTLGTLLSMAALSTTAYAHDHGGDTSKKMDKMEKMMDKYDANGDGNLSQEEFMTHAQEKFTKMDANGDGMVSKEELKKKYHDKKRDKKADM